MDSLHIYPLDDQFVAFRTGLDRLHLLNATSREALLRLAAGDSRTSIADTWVERFGLDPARSLSLMDETSRALHSSGLMGALPQVTERKVPALRRARAHCPVTAPPAIDYCIGHHPFSLRCSSPQLLHVLLPYLKHLQVEDQLPGRLFEVVELDDGYCLNCGPDELHYAYSEQDLVLAVVFHTNEIARDDGTHLAVLHAGAVRRHNHCVAILGAGGAGKTTLVTYLSHHGCDYLADDMLPLNANSLQVEPVPSSTRVKAGSWPVVAAFRPDILEQPILQDGDKLIRMLTPTVALPQAWAVAHEVAAIILVEYAAGATAQLVPISAPDTLRAIIESETYFPLPLRPERIKGLLEWISSTPAYRLRYGTLADVPEMLDSILKP